MARGKSIPSLREFGIAYPELALIGTHHRHSNSLSKFYELQDFFSDFFIVAGKHREAEFADKIEASIFSPITGRVRFLSYEKVAAMHSTLRQQASLRW